MKNSRGFTLIELLVVISIIGVLSGIVLQSLKSVRIKARNIQRIANAEAIAKGFQIAILDTTGKFPNTGNTWRCLGKASCQGGIYFNIPAIDTLLKTGMAGGQIPTLSVGSWDSYIYHSNFSIGPVYAARLKWMMESPDPNNLSTFFCGRGEVDVLGPLPQAYYYCLLNMGPPTII